MALIEQQNFLARIFTDESLRLSFWENPDQIGAENGLTTEEIIEFKQIIADDLNFFANSLFHKRLHEVEKILPLTKRALDTEFTKLFRDFSNNFQPNSIKKHLEDAIEFCKNLQFQQITPSYIKDTAKFEQTRLEFFSQEKKFSICLLRHDVFSNKKKIGCAIWLRIGKNIRHFIL